MKSLVENFSQNFCVVLATTEQQRQFAYAIRHQVYAEELGWEPLNDRRLETDAYDNYAYHCLLEHKRSGDIVGCVRLVPSPVTKFESSLPCQIHPIPMKSGYRSFDFNAATVGEISRLAVPGHFRRCATEKGKPFILNQHSSSTTIYSKKERRAFSKISTGLYLSAIAMVDLCGLEHVLAVMEPSLQRHLQRFGLMFHQISHPFKMRGSRALFMLPHDELTANMNDSTLKLYHPIRSVLDKQYEKILQPHNNSFQAHDYL